MTAINRIDDEDIKDFMGFGSLAQYQSIATKSAIYPGKGTLLGMSYCAHKLAGEAGEFNEHFGKAQRDDNLFSMSGSYEEIAGGQRSVIIIRPLTAERKAFLIKEIGDVLWYLSALCNELGISLFEAALINLRKLKDRTDRNALQGSGDER